MKNKKYLGLVILLLLTIATGYVVSGTYAKYTSGISGDDTATVAKWAWKVNDRDINLGEATFAMDNLFSNSELYDTDGNQNCTTTKETDVKTTGSTALIAPGTCGKFTIKLTNASEVTATYSYELVETNASNVPIEYSLDNSTWGALSTLSINGTLASNQSNSGDTIYWRWKFNGADTTDTNLGTSTASPTVGLTAKITLTQVN